MEYHILGSMRVASAERSGLPSAPKQRQVLAVLVLQANRFVSAEALVTELWNDRPPRSWSPTLQTYVAQVRRFLAEVGGRRVDDVMQAELLTESGGYRLVAEPGQIDARRFERAVVAGRAALASHRRDEAVEHFRAAHELWQGPPLENVRHGHLIEIQAHRLEQLHIATVEARCDLEIELGRHAEVTAELAELTAQHPLHENLHALLMKALYRSGRQSDALQAFLSLRHRLASELGLDPSPNLAALQGQILNRVEPEAMRLVSGGACGTPT